MSGRGTRNRGSHARTTDTVGVPMRGAMRAFAEVTEGRWDYDLHGVGRNGVINCSQYVRVCVDGVTDHLVNQGVLNRQQAQTIDALFDGSSEMQFENITRYARPLSESDIRRTGLREGMILYFDTGPTSYDQGRRYGIDHTGFVTRDENGRLVIAHSSSSGNGSDMTPAQDYFDRMAASGVVRGVMLDDVIRGVACMRNPSIAPFTF